MNTAPLIALYQPDDILAWEGASPITARRFLSDVLECADRLPTATAVLNMAQDRYRFLIGLAAAILRRQVTLLPQSTAAKTLADIAARWPDCYCLTDGLDTPVRLPVFHFARGSASVASRFMVPAIPLDQPVVVAFTSGTTGAPSANTKTWKALVNVAHDTGACLGLGGANRPSIIATVPQQHMFGLEASIMLALQHGCAVYTGRPLFPADVGTALSTCPRRAFLSPRRCTSRRWWPTVRRFQASIASFLRQRRFPKNWHARPSALSRLRSMRSMDLQKREVSPHGERHKKTYGARWTESPWRKKARTGSSAQPIYPSRSQFRITLACTAIIPLRCMGGGRIKSILRAIAHP